MAKRRTPRQTQPRLPDDVKEVAFVDAVRRLPAVQRAGVLAWLRRWRRRPGRVFWVMDAAGRWELLF
jgi:hypothetical protein